jgi:hypothetical protein
VVGCIWKRFFTTVRKDVATARFILDIDRNWIFPFANRLCGVSWLVVRAGPSTKIDAMGLGHPIRNSMLRGGCGPDHFSLPNTANFSSWNRSISPVALLRTGLPTRASLLGPNNSHNAFLCWRCLFDRGIVGTTNASGFTDGQRNSILGEPCCRTRLSCGGNILTHSSEENAVSDPPIRAEWLGGIALAILGLLLRACRGGRLSNLLCRLVAAQGTNSLHSRHWVVTKSHLLVVEIAKFPVSDNAVSQDLA